VRRPFVAPWSSALLTGAAIVAFGAAALHSYTRQHGIRWRSPVTQPTQSAAGWAPGGRELVLIYVGSPTCAFSNSREIPGLVAQASSLLKAHADSLGASMTTIGAAQSASTADGLLHLEGVGHFDEITAGRAWYNSLFLRWVYGDAPGPAATPQLIVLYRRGAKGLSPGLETEVVLIREVGLGALQRWIDHGAPIPQLPDSSGTAPTRRSA
jgi:hypothetical protein